MNVKDTVNSEQRLSQAQGRALTDLARRTIAAKLGCPIREIDPPQLRDALADAALQRRCGTFVTLKIDDRLRGCIGSLDTRESLIEGVRRNAVNAAFHDPRFSPLTRDEFERTGIEVSVLTRPRPLAYADAKDLIAKLRPKVDGLIIRKGRASATFLPQVWEQLPGPEDFLSHLCMKAGLSADAWHRGDLEVETYQVQYFEEPR
jgi:AmmeMemoRadiSam system protein A